MKYNRTEIAESIGYSTIIDDKFKTCTISVRFLTMLDKNTAAANSLAVSELSSTNSTYRSIASMNEKLSSLYGASLASSTRKRGDVQVLSVGASWITNKYTFDGEDVDGEMLSIFHDCIFSPEAENGAFGAETFEINKKDLLDRIDAEINDKRSYALARAAEVTFAGENAANSCYGTRESASDADPKSVYEAYLNLLRTAQIEILFVSPEEKPEAERIFREGFAKLLREPKACTFRSKSPVKAEVAESSDTFDVRQCKMVLSFKTDTEDRFGLKMMSVMLGEIPVSKLFMNVREKLSLCYYCACRTQFIKGAFIIDSGVEKANIEKAKTEIMHQIEDMQNGNFTDEDIENAILALENGLRSVGDTPGAYIGWYFECFCSGELLTPQQQAEKYREVTRERIIAAAKSLRPDSVYLMLGKEAE